MAFNEQSKGYHFYLDITIDSKGGGQRNKTIDFVFCVWETGSLHAAGKIKFNIKDRERDR